jgi:hypothetical protein
MCSINNILECSCNKCKDDLIKLFNCSCNSCTKHRVPINIGACSVFNYLQDKIELMKYVDTKLDIDIIDYNISYTPSQIYNNENIVHIFSYLLNILNKLDNKLNKCLLSVIIFEIVFKCKNLVCCNNKFSDTIYRKIFELSYEDDIIELSKKFNETNILLNFRNNFGLFYKDSKEIMIKLFGIKCVKYIIYGNLKVKTIKKSLKDIEDINKRKLILVYENKTLDDNLELLKMNFKKDSVLYLF